MERTILLTRDHVVHGREHFISDVFKLVREIASQRSSNDINVVRVLRDVSSHCVVPLVKLQGIFNGA